METECCVCSLMTIAGCLLMFLLPPKTIWVCRAASGVIVVFKKSELCFWLLKTCFTVLGAVAVCFSVVCDLATSTRVDRLVILKLIKIFVLIKISSS